MVYLASGGDDYIPSELIDLQQFLKARVPTSATLRISGIADRAERCFLGTHVIQLLLQEELAESVPEAMQLCTEMASLGLLCSVNGPDGRFRGDDSLFYFGSSDSGGVEDIYKDLNGNDSESTDSDEEYHRHEKPRRVGRDHRAFQPATPVLKNLKVKVLDRYNRSRTQYRPQPEHQEHYSQRKLHAVPSYQPPPPAYKQITFAFPDGPLLISLNNVGKGEVIREGIEIQRVDNPMLAGQIRKGDLLVAIAGEPVDGMEMKHLKRMIVSLPRPIAITFRKYLINEAASQSLRSIPEEPQHPQKLQPYYVSPDDLRRAHSASSYSHIDPSVSAAASNQLSRTVSNIPSGYSDYPFAQNHYQPNPYPMKAHSPPLYPSKNPPPPIITNDHIPQQYERRYSQGPLSQAQQANSNLAYSSSSNYARSSPPPLPTNSVHAYPSPSRLSSTSSVSSSSSSSSASPTHRLSSSSHGIASNPRRSSLSSLTSSSSSFSRGSFSVADAGPDLMGVEPNREDEFVGLRLSSSGRPSWHVSSSSPSPYSQTNPSSLRSTPSHEISRASTESERLSAWELGQPQIRRASIEGEKLPNWELRQTPRRRMSLEDTRKASTEAKKDPAPYLAQRALLKPIKLKDNEFAEKKFAPDSPVERNLNSFDTNPAEDEEDEVEPRQTEPFQPTSEAETSTPMKARKSFQITVETKANESVDLPLQKTYQSPGKHSSTASTPTIGSSPNSSPSSSSPGPSALSFWKNKETSFRRSSSPSLSQVPTSPGSPAPTSTTSSLSSDSVMEPGQPSASTPLPSPSHLESPSPPAQSLSPPAPRLSSLSSSMGVSSTYSFTFREHQSMGLRLDHEIYAGYEITYVKGVTGQAAESALIREGDVILRVKGVDVLGNPHKKIIDILRSLTFPKTVEFVSRAGLDDELDRIRQEEEREMTISALNMGQYRAVHIKSGILYKMGNMVKSWKPRYFHISVECIAFFKDAAYAVPRGRLHLVDARCAVRSIPGDPMIMISRKPKLWAKHLLEIRVNDTKLVLAAASREDKNDWLDAFQLAIDAANSLKDSPSLDRGEAYARAVQLANQRSEAEGAFYKEAGGKIVGGDSSGNFLDDEDETQSAMGSENEIGTVILVDGRKFPRPRVHVAVISASSLKETTGSIISASSTASSIFSAGINPYCEVSLGHENFRTPVVKGQRNPVWTDENDCTLESPSYDGGILQIRVKSQHTLRGDELLSTLTIDLRDLPNMQKVIRKFPLVLGYTTMQQATITLALEYQNPKLEFEQSQQLKTMSAKGFQQIIAEERERAVEMQECALEALEEAQKRAQDLQQEAERLVEEARVKAGEELDKARAQIEALRRESEAKRAEVEQIKDAAKDMETRNRAIVNLDLSSALVPYVKMVAEHQPLDEIQTRMIEAGIPEITVKAFIEGNRARESTLAYYQKELKKAREDQKARVNQAALSTDQTALLRRLAKLEKQLQIAGIQIAEDIPYEEAKSKVEEISRRMSEIGSADVVHEDPQTQRQLREEYFRLEQEMEKYNSALMLTEEYQEEQQRIEREWDEKHRVENEAALRAVRRMMPVNVKSMTQQELVVQGVPPAIAQRFKRTDVLQLLRVDPQTILKWHPSTLESARTSGLTLQERRALYLHFRDIAEKWREQQREELAGRKWTWFTGVKQSFKYQLDQLERGHRFGRDAVTYNIDLGFPEGPAYMAVQVTKAELEDAGVRALQEAQAHARAVRANARKSTLKEHYRGDIRSVAAAEGAIIEIENTMDSLEVEEMKWISDRMLGISEPRSEVAGFTRVLNELKSVCMSMAERAGIPVSGKRSGGTAFQRFSSAYEMQSMPDSRSLLEISFCAELLDWVMEYVDVIQTLLREPRLYCPSVGDTSGRSPALGYTGTEGIRDAKIQSVVQTLTELTHEMRMRNHTTTVINRCHVNPEGSILVDQRPLRPRAERLRDISQKVTTNTAQQVSRPTESSVSYQLSRAVPLPQAPRPPQLHKNDRDREDFCGNIQRDHAANNLFSAIKAHGNRNGFARNVNESPVESRPLPAMNNSILAAIAQRRASVEASCDTEQQQSQYSSHGSPAVALSGAFSGNNTGSNPRPAFMAAIAARNL